MKIIDVELDYFDREEYFSFLKSLCDYYSCLFGQTLILKEEEC